MRRKVEKFLLLRFTVPLMIVSAMSLALISELTYQRTKTTLTDGIALTDARMSGTQLLQLLTDAETAQRAFLITGNTAYLETLKNAQSRFNESSTFLEFIATIGDNGSADVKKIRAAVAEKFAALDRSVEIGQTGDRALALELLQADAGKRVTDELRTVFSSKLAEATLLQQHAREDIYSALWFNRTAVFVLALLLAAGLYLHLRQSRSLEQERNDRQQSLETEVAEKTHQLLMVAGYLETAREDEKAHLARELHDELGSLLTAAKLTMARMRAKLSADPEMLERIASVNKCLNEGIALKRKIVEDLRPSTLSMFGLHVALGNLCADAAERMGIRVTTEIDEVQISPNAQLAIFRVVQEAVTNIGKYAQATEVSVRLKQTASELRVEVTDNGVGFDMATSGAGKHGLAGMQFRIERYGGSLSIVSAKQQGVRIVATLPLQSIMAPVFEGEDALVVAA